MSNKKEGKKDGKDVNVLPIALLYSLILRYFFRCVCGSGSVLVYIYNDIYIYYMHQIEVSKKEGGENNNNGDIHMFVCVLYTHLSLFHLPLFPLMSLSLIYSPIFPFLFHPFMHTYINTLHTYQLNYPLVTVQI